MKKIKQLAKDEIKCLTEEEYFIERLINTLEYLFNNVNQTVNKEQLNQLYYLLTKSLHNEEVEENIVKLYYSNSDNYVNYLNSIIHLFIVETIINNNLEFAFIISTLIMLKKNNLLIFHFKYSHLNINKSIQKKIYHRYQDLS